MSVSVRVCVSQSLPMAATSPVDIERCAVAVYQSKAKFNEGARKPKRAYSHACTHIHAYNTRGVFHSFSCLIPILLFLIIPLSFGLKNI